MQVKLKKLEHYPKDWALPEYATDGAACFDLRAVITEKICDDNGLNYQANKYSESEDWIPYLTVDKRIVISTQLSIEIPKDHVMLIFSRSGHGFKNSVRLGNCVGVIDSDYRGEIKIAIANDGPYYFNVTHGDRIAQAMIIPHPKVEFIEDELSDTDRGDGGFGSTDA